VGRLQKGCPEEDRHHKGYPEKGRQHKSRVRKEGCGEETEDNDVASQVTQPAGWRRKPTKFVGFILHALG
jgi:hypothetical protein